MNLQERIKSDLKDAMIAKNVPIRDLLRVVIGDIDRDPKIVGKILDDVYTAKIVKKMYDNAVEFNNTSEIEILDVYLPKMLSESEHSSVITSIIMDNGYDGMKNMGAIITELKAKYGASIDGKIASDFIRNYFKK